MGLRTRPWYRNLICITTGTKGRQSCGSAGNQGIRDDDEGFAAREMIDLVERFRHCHTRAHAAREALTTL
jgi:hypothetical protein